MHHILDVVEDMLRESVTDEDEWARIQMRLYTPGKNDRDAEGWSEDDQMESFDAFIGAVGS